MRKYLSNFLYPENTDLLKANNWNTAKRFEICSKLTKKTPERHQWCRSGVFIVNFEHISQSFSSVTIIGFEQVMFAGECLSVYTCIKFANADMEQRIQEWTKWNLWKTAFKKLLQKKYLQKNVFVFSEEKSFVIFLVSCTFYITQFCFKNFSSVSHFCISTLKWPFNWFHFHLRYL